MMHFVGVENLSLPVFHFAFLSGGLNEPQIVGEYSLRERCARKIVQAKIDYSSLPDNLVCAWGCVCVCVFVKKEVKKKGGKRESAFKEMENKAEEVKGEKGRRRKREEKQKIRVSVFGC